MNLFGLLADGGGGSAWMPKAASTVAKDVDLLYDVILYLSTAFFIGIIGAMVYFTVKYRRKKEGERTGNFTHNSTLELVWIVIPSILLVGMFFWGFTKWMDMRVAPDNALEIRVTGRQWSWQFDYPRDGVNGANELVVPVGRPIRLIMTSMDVLHSFYVPEFRVKQDVLPRRYTTLWFEAPETGTFNVFCAEYCGKDHSRMITRVKVLSAEDYQKWIDSGGGLGDMPLPDLGKIFFTRFGCSQCHNTDGTPSTGPNLDGRFGKMETLSDGTQVAVDDNYVRESMMNPAGQIVQGFQPKMPTFKGKIKEKQIVAIIEYLKSIGK